MIHRRNSEVAERTRQRQQREDEAPRLHEEFPSLESLKLEMSYRRGDTNADEATHVRQVVLGRAPSLFVVPCANRDCKDGGHDITQEVIRGLRGSRERFEGKMSCNGTLGSAGAPCTSVLSYTVIAKYKPGT